MNSVLTADEKAELIRLELLRRNEAFEQARAAQEAQELERARALEEYRATLAAKTIEQLEAERAAL